MKFGNEFWLILFREYISPNLFAVYKEIRKGSVAKSYMTNGLLYLVKYLRISSYIRKPFLIYHFAIDPI